MTPPFLLHRITGSQTRSSFHGFKCLTGSMSTLSYENNYQVIELKNVWLQAACLIFFNDTGVDLFIS
jgi:hypothetical protein